MKRAFRLLKFLAMGSFSLILTACYGIAYEIMYGTPYVSRIFRVTVRDDSGEPIPGLLVTSAPHARTLTDHNGIADLHVIVDDTSPETIDISVQDIDGSGNGGEFESKSTQASSNAYDETVRVDLFLSEGLSDTQAAGTESKSVSVNVVNTDNEPLPGISIAVYDVDYFEPKLFELITDVNGQAAFDYSLLSSGYSLYLEDVDGQLNNGSYENHDVVVNTENESDPVVVNIVLQKYQ